VGIRNTRRDAIDDAKQMEKEKILSEDDVRRAQDEIQKITDDYVARVDQLLAEKEEELMKV
jgi:ribosome recycling factor